MCPMDLNKEWREDQERTPKDTSPLLRRDQSLCGKCLDWDGLVTEVLTLLYLRSAKLTPSPAPTRVDGGVVRDV